MTLEIAFRAAARRELSDGAAWYEARHIGLGEDFLAEIKRCVAQASVNPEHYPRVRGDVRRVLARRFPYAVYFRCRADLLVVIAVFHVSRHPKIWQSRR